MKKFLLASSLLIAPIAGMAQSSQETAMVVTREINEKEIEQKIDALLATMQKRLSLMGDMAKWKWNNAQPIEDLSGEKALLDELCAQYEKSGLDKSTIKALFLAQLRAEKMIQINLFEEWVKQGADKLDGAASTAKGLKAKLEDLNRELLDQMKELTPHIKQEKYQALIEQRAEKLLKGNKIDDQVRKAAVEPLTAKN